MGSIVKKIKKKVKKIIKKNPITKIIKKQVKNIKKLGTKVWNGIKKVGGKAFQAFAKFSDKIGPIGMIALSFAMPYLTAGMGSLWGGMGTALKAGMGSTNAFVSTMSTLGNSAYQAIGTAGSFVKGTYQGITQTLSKTFSSFGKGNVTEGFSNLWGGTKDVFSGRAGIGTELLKPVPVPGYNGSIIQGTGDFTGNAGGIFGGTSSGVVETGGVNAFKANQLNQASYKVIQNAMANTTAGYDAVTKKYVNTISKQFNLNAHDAHEHFLKNGGVDMGNGSFSFDMSTSGDFKKAIMKPGRPPVGPNMGYEYTGGSANLNFANKNTQYLGINKNLGTIEGPTYGYGSPDKPSLLDKAKKGAKTALSALAGQGDDPQQNYLPYGGADTYLNSMVAGYGGSNVDTSAGGTFLSEDQQRFASNQQSLLNFRGTASA
tara:strand:- start:42 stop:1331 length:1290 start_codon:yes stop_codon:yes gene_type:complete